MAKKKQKPIETFLESSNVEKGRALVDRLPPEVYKAIEEDLWYVAEQKRKGVTVPSYASLANYVLDEHGVKISMSTARSWVLRLVQEDAK